MPRQLNGDGDGVCGDDDGDDVCDGGCGSDGADGDDDDGGDDADANRKLKSHVHFCRHDRGARV